MDNEQSGVIEAHAEASSEQLMASGIEVLQIRKGDTVIVRANASTQEQVMFITQAFAAVFQQRGLGPEDVSLLIIPGNLDIKILDQEQMKAQGWMRTSRIKIARPGSVPDMPDNGFPRR